jgi:hypothetical protein
MRPVTLLVFRDRLPVVRSQEFDRLGQGFMPLGQVLQSFFDAQHVLPLGWMLDRD